MKKINLNEILPLLDVIKIEVGKFYFKKGNSWLTKEYNLSTSFNYITSYNGDVPEFHGTFSKLFTDEFCKRFDKEFETLERGAPDRPEFIIEKDGVFLNFKNEWRLEKPQWEEIKNKFSEFLKTKFEFDMPVSLLFED